MRRFTKSLIAIVAIIVMAGAPVTSLAATRQLTASERAQLESQIATLRILVLQLQAKLAELLKTQSTPFQPRAINPQSIVGLVCYATNTFTNPLNGFRERSVQLLDKGSGVIISPQGEIATSLHLVESRNVTVPFNYGGGSIDVNVHQEFSYCEVGQVPSGTTLPTISDIQTINPITRIPILAYKATISKTPSDGDKTALESDYSDFALLKIEDITPAGIAAGISLPTTFPYAPLLSATVVPTGAQVVSYGFPGDITKAQSGSFETLYFSGSIGTVTGIAYGTAYYANKPIYISTDMEIQLGRSGSPLFWNGYVIGIIRGFEPDNRAKSYSVASDIIMKERESF
jgi:S1-C subfamily serine protease